MKKTPEELKNISKEDVHDGYKKILSHVLMDFYIDCTNSEKQIETVQDLTDFVTEWVKKKIRPPHQYWNPGDSGK